jgi:hypothetical protein
MKSMIPKALFSSHHLFDACLNPAYKSTLEENRQYFSTDLEINGEYFRSRTDNQYFCLAPKDKNFDILGFMKRREFRPLEFIHP